MGNIASRAGFDPTALVAFWGCMLTLSITLPIHIVWLNACYKVHPRVILNLLNGLCLEQNISPLMLTSILYTCNV